MTKKKRKIVTAEFKIETTKIAKKEIKTLTFMAIGETINEVTEIFYKEKNRYHIKKLVKVLNLSPANTFKLISMDIKQEHGYTNYEI